MRGFRDQFGVLLEGLRGLGDYGLEATPGFDSFRHATLRSAVSDQEEAGGVVATLLREISRLSRVLPEDELRELVGSRIVSTSLEEAGLPASDEFIRRFGIVRSSAPRDTAAGAVWLAALLESEIRDGRAERHIANNDRFAYIQSREDLAIAKQLTAATAPSPSGFESWAQTVFAGALEDTAPEDDFDHDGVPNLVEYALGMDPTIASPVGLPIMAVETTDSADRLFLRYAIDPTKTDVTCRVQTSTDPGSTPWTTSGVTDRLVESNELVEHREASVPFDSSRRFLRLHVEMK